MFNCTRLVIAVETLRKSVSEAKGRAARAEAEAALQAAGVARLEAQLQRVRARQDATDEREERLKQERRKLQREVIQLRHVAPSSFYNGANAAVDQSYSAPSRVLREITVWIKPLRASSQRFGSLLRPVA